MSAMDLKVMVADDDAVMRTLVCDILRKEKYVPIEAKDGQEVLDYFFKHPDIDLIILDVMMPKYDGWEVLKEIRIHSEVPILMLTALADEKHEIKGLQKGADEYIGKPFSYEKLIARIDSLLRKVKVERSAEIVLSNLIIDQMAQRVYVGGTEIELSRKEFQLLLYFIRNAKQVLDREQLLNHIWGFDFEGDPRTVDTHIKTLRFKLKSCGEWITTVRGMGYRFEVMQ
jgi:DNA-binding response OmpR family regulator